MKDSSTPPPCGPHRDPRDAPSKLDWILAKIFIVIAILATCVYVYFAVKRGPLP